MNFAGMIEAADGAPGRRPVYAAALAGAMVAIVMLRASQYFSALPPPVTDFDAFYLAARLTLAGRIADAYDMTTFIAHQRAILGTANLFAWTYPPPYNLVVAPLGLTGLPIAFAGFMAATLAAYLWTLWRLAGAHLVTLLVLMLLPVYIVVVCGQNGLLTGALLGLACLGLRHRRAWAGIPLGLMIIKPHLAIGLGLYVLLGRDWRVLGVAAATVLGFAGLATLVCGTGVWPAFLAGVGDTAGLLHSGRYPLFRMVSPFASLYSLGVPTALALAGQAVAALAAVPLIAIAQRRLPQGAAIGIAVIAALLISPYVFDYDLAIVGMGLAVMLPTLVERSGTGARSAIYALLLFASGYGIGHLVLVTAPGAGRSPVGLLIILCLALVWRALATRPQPA